MTRQEALELLSLPPDHTESEVLAAVARLEAELPVAPTPEQQRILDQQRARITAAKSLLLGSLPVLDSIAEPQASAASTRSAPKTRSAEHATSERVEAMPANTPLRSSPTFVTWLKSPVVFGIVLTVAVVAVVLLFIRQQRIQRELDERDAAAQEQLESLQEQQEELREQLEDEKAARERERQRAMEARRPDAP